MHENKSNSNSNSKSPELVMIKNQLQDGVSESINLTLKIEAMLTKIRISNDPLSPENEEIKEPKQSLGLVTDFANGVKDVEQNNSRLRSIVLRLQSLVGLSIED